MTWIAFAHDGHTMASFDGTVILWDLTDPTRPAPIRQPLVGPPDAVVPIDRAVFDVGSVAFSPDWHTLATANYDGTVILWDLTDPTRPTRAVTDACRVAR